jgi:hypothetical protein
LSGGAECEHAPMLGARVRPCVTRSAPAVLSERRPVRHLAGCPAPPPRRLSLHPATEPVRGRKWRACLGGSA